MASKKRKETSSKAASKLKSSRAERMAVLLEELWETYPDPKDDPCFPYNPPGDTNTITTEETEEDRLKRKRIGQTFWCKCTKCKAMPTGDESVCCSEISSVSANIPPEGKCITEAETFKTMIVHKQNINIQHIMLNMKTLRAHNFMHNRNKRKTAYKSFTAWVHGYLGKGNRRPIPACAVHAVRETFPDPDCQYTGFSYDYNAADMALE